jgi:hypothetical protein
MTTNGFQYRRPFRAFGEAPFRFPLVAEMCLGKACSGLGESTGQGESCRGKGHGRLG